MTQSLPFSYHFGIKEPKWAVKSVLILAALFGAALLFS